MDVLHSRLADSHSSAIREIPREVWYEILVDAELADVLSLQSTCTPLHDALHVRAVWIFILRSLCQRRYIFFPSYPIDEMDVVRVERAALGHSRFAHLLQDNSSLTDDSPALRPMARSIVSLSEPQDHEELYLVPGGRFLITASRHAVDLWDLGYPDCSALKQPHHVAHVDIEEHRLNTPTPIQLEVKMNREDELRVCVAMGGIILNVYDIRPSEPAASFHLVGSLTLNVAHLNPWHAAKCTGVRVEGDIVFVEAWSYTRFEPFLLWNVRTGWYGFVPDNHIRSSVLYKDMLIILSDDTLFVHDIPQSQRQRTQESSPSLPKMPQVVFLDNVVALEPRDQTGYAVTMSACHDRLVPGITAVPLSTGPDPYLPRRWTLRPHFQLPLTSPNRPQNSREIILDIACTWDHHIEMESDRWKGNTTFLYRYLFTVTTYAEQGDRTWYEASFKEDRKSVV